MMNYIGLGLLFLAIIYTGNKVNVYWRLRSELGKLVLSLSPTKSQKKYLLLSGVAFVVLLTIVTSNYIGSGIPLNFSYTMFLALVVYSTGRFMDSICELREGGMIGQLKNIPYATIKKYDFVKQRKKYLAKFDLTTRMEFVAIVSQRDEQALKQALQKLKYGKNQ